MAAAARPNPGDGRVPCPLCGALVHPLAGRCKHCKADLGELRGQRPAAAGALPALQAPIAPPIVAPPIAPSPHAPHVPSPHAPPAPQPYTPYAQAPTNGHYAHPPVPQQAILPPRPTGRLYAQQPRASAGWWKSWPVFVIAIAGIAIVVAVVLMVWPPGGKDEKGGTKANTPPAPDRMDTNPLPGRSSKDPPKKSTPPPSIDIPDDPDPGTPSLGGGPGPGGVPGGPGAVPGGPGATPGNPSSTIDAMTKVVHARLCIRIKACGTLDDYTYSLICDAAPKSPPPAPTCPAAQRCLAAVDKLSCGTQSADWLSEAMGLNDCLNAMHC